MRERRLFFKLMILFVCAVILPSVRLNAGNMIGIPEYLGNNHYQSFDQLIKYVEPDFHKLTPDQIKIITQKTEKIAKLALKNPVIAKPEGVEVFVNAVFESKSEYYKFLPQIRYTVYLAFEYWYKDGNKKDYTKPSYEATEGINIIANDPFDVFGGENASILGGDLYDETGNVIIKMPRVIGEQNGYPIYETGVVIISKPGIPLYVPVTVKEYFDLNFKALEKNPDPMVKKIFTPKMKEALKQFTKEQLNMPAWFDAGTAETLGIYTEEGILEGVSRQLMKLNPKYFNPKQPDTDIQLLVIQCDMIGGGQEGPYYDIQDDPDNPVNRLRVAQALAAFDYSDFVQFLDIK